MAMLGLKGLVINGDAIHEAQVLGEDICMGQSHNSAKHFKQKASEMQRESTGISSPCKSLIFKLMVKK
jgi:hypothetical protein